MKVVFIDPKCPRPYDSTLIDTEGLGGTEATVIRIAEGLTATHHVSVIQHNRAIPASFGTRNRLFFLPESELEYEVKNADHVVFLNRAQGLGRIHRKTRARLWIWLHNYLEDEVPWFWRDHIISRLGFICVSATHAKHTLSVLKRSRSNHLTAGWILRGGVRHIYNPIDPVLENCPESDRDVNKLIFFSSPHKGLDQVLSSFAEIRKLHPHTELWVANPGYLKDASHTLLSQPGIRSLGSIRKSELARHITEANFVLYPQTRVPETFGLVFAESHALRTPVLAHDFGAAREVLGPRNPPINANSPDEIIKTASDWLTGKRPAVNIDMRFKLNTVLCDWLSFLSAPDEFQRD